MKKSTSAAAFAILATVMAHATAEATGCRYQLSGGVQEVRIAKNEVVDVCLPDGDVIGSVDIGNSDAWNIRSIATGAALAIRERQDGANVPMNVIIWTIGTPRKRFELQLRSAELVPIEQFAIARTNLPSQPAAGATPTARTAH